MIPNYRHAFVLQRIQCHCKNKCSNEWQLGFKPKKCKVMHIGQPLQNVTKYFMSEDSTKVEVQSVDVKKNLGVYFTKALAGFKGPTSEENKGRKRMGRNTGKGKRG